MDKLKMLLDEELVNFTSKLPVHTGSVFSYSQRVKKVLDLTDDFRVSINRKANEFVEENQFNELQIEEVKNISQEYLNRFLVSFA